MNPYPYQLKIILDIAIAGLLIFCTWYFTSDHYQKKIDEIQLGMAAAVQTQLISNQQQLIDEAAKRKTAEESHAKDQLTINHLRDDAQRMQITGICSGAMPTSGEAGTNTDRGSGLLSERVDAAFAILQAGVGQLIQRCEQLNIDARMFNAQTR